MRCSFALLSHFAASMCLVSVLRAFSCSSIPLAAVSLLPLPSLRRIPSCSPNLPRFLRVTPPSLEGSHASFARYGLISSPASTCVMQPSPQPPPRLDAARQTPFGTTATAIVAVTDTWPSRPVPNLGPSSFCRRRRPPLSLLFSSLFRKACRLLDNGPVSRGLERRAILTSRFVEFID